MSRDAPLPLKACPNSPLIKVEGLGKSYGDLCALSDLSFELYPGDLLGFLGPNGSGKTTALRILATVLRPSCGTAWVGGHPISEVQEVRIKMGYMPDFIGSYDDLTIDEYMEFFARAYLVPPDMRAFAKKEALVSTGLLDLAHRPVQGLSRGQSQRLALARLLMHDPPVLLLDEPAAGLDPRARVELRDILKELQKRKKAIIVSSHVLEDLSDLCNKIAVVENGKLLAFGATRELMTQLTESRRWVLRTTDPSPSDRLREALLAWPNVTGVEYEQNALVMTFSGDENEVADLHTHLVTEGFRLVEFAEQALSLEDLYLRITGIGK